MVDLTSLWDSGLLLFFLSIALVIALDIMVMVWVSRGAYRNEPKPADETPAASEPAPSSEPGRAGRLIPFADLREAAS